MPARVELLGFPFVQQAVLLGMAYADEQATHHRIAPETLPALPPDAIAGVDDDSADEGSTGVDLAVPVLIGFGAVVLLGFIGWRLLALRRARREV